MAERCHCRRLCSPLASGTQIAVTKSVVYHLLRLAYDFMEMRRALEALRVDLVDVFGAGGPRREPAVFRHNFQSADGSLIARVLIAPC